MTDQPLDWPVTLIFKDYTTLSDTVTVPPGERQGRGRAADVPDGPVRYTVAAMTDEDRREWFDVTGLVASREVDVITS